MLIFSALIKIITQSITTLGAGETQELFLLSLSFTTLNLLFSFTPSSVSAWK